MSLKDGFAKAKPFFSVDFLEIFCYNKRNLCYLEDRSLDDAEGDADPKHDRKNIFIKRGIVTSEPDAAMSFCVFIWAKLYPFLDKVWEGLQVGKKGENNKTNVCAAKISFHIFELERKDFYM